ncbi:hypothetical protein Lesp02_06820 [Lentzea sp. NBRC 105346]|uniref:SMP-30/gluconolactonase/LRE family protein n=1 Tax=Lentzea sp. NBRC 105346 TaxID=3032205 RepID=UPI0024A3ED1F|nr:hypothetical protein [Lentzea sp. NBRC 105346]GLZ28492.1 hypothetical protein Lesp02_06820 [Lentzea sp. NBRC 105346]
MTKRSLLLAAVALAAATAVPAHAAQPDRAIVLPGASSAEGIASGRGSTFYAGDLFRGDIFRGDVRAGTASKFIDVPDGSRMAVGMAVDLTRHWLFVAGGPSFGYVYDLDTGATLATYAFGGGFVNDVALTDAGAWFTDSNVGQLYFVPFSLGPHRTLALSGPAADTSSQFNNNGIQATTDGTRLIVAHSGQGALNVVDPATGASSTIAGVSVPFVDGILLESGRLWAVQNFMNQVSSVRLAQDLSSGSVTGVITSPLFQVPTTVARVGGSLALVNGKFDTGLPPTASQYEVVVVDR